MLGQTSSPVLARAEQALISKVPPQLKDALSKVVNAGMQVLYAPKLSAQLKQKLATTDPLQTAAEGAVNMIGELWKQSKMTIPKPVIVPAMLLFAYEYLDLAEKAGRLQITPQAIAQVTQAATSKLIAVTKQAAANAGQQPGATSAGAPGAPPSTPPSAPAGGIIANAVAPQGAQ